MRPVVVTGMAGICALGSDWPTIEAGLRRGRNAVHTMPSWDMYKDLNTRLAAPIEGFEPPAHWNRKQLRSMGRVSQLAVGLRNSHSRMRDCSAIRCCARAGSAWPAARPSAARRTSATSPRC